MATVIKAGDAVRIAKRLTTIDLADHVAEARAVLEQAEREAARIVAVARRDAARLLEEARQEGGRLGRREGHEAGRTAGFEEARGEALERFDREQAQVVAAMQGAVAEMDAMKEGLAVAAERDLLEFATGVARKLTFAIGTLHREAALENLRRALALVGSSTELTIRANPDDVDAMGRFAASALRRAERSPAVHIVADDAIAPGGCRVETAASEIDATLETQMNEVVSLLLGKGNGDA